MRIAQIAVAAVLFVGCKSAQPTIGTSQTTAESGTSAQTVIDGHYANPVDFNTAMIKASARYEDAKQSQNVSADIRIKKDEKILVSIRFLGITMAKALITPSEVKYYEKINGEFFEGDYKALSKWLGTDLDFQKVQNLLLGKALDDLSKGQYKMSVEDKLYKLEDASARSTKKSFWFDAGTFLVKKEEISQPSQNRSLEVKYPGFSTFGKNVLPAKILLQAMLEKGKTDIEIEYNSATFNEELSFPYSVPEGYERQEID